MHNIRKWIRFLFGFSRRETNGFLILLPLMVIAIFSQPFFRMISGHGDPDFSKEQAMIDSLQEVLQAEDGPAGQALHASVSRKFKFDPNKLNASEFVMLGIPPAVSNRIVRYREKGGTFRKKIDLLKIYGLDSSLFEQLYPFIELPENSGISTSRRHDGASVSSSPQKRFDLNAADTVVLKKVRGIGTVLASRIVRFRSKLGGFVSKDQLYEVYRLDSIAISELSGACFISEAFIPRQLSLNDANLRELSSHPYISEPIARILSAYRFQHGKFETVEDVLAIHGISDSIFHKIRPYLKTD